MAKTQNLYKNRLLGRGVRLKKLTLCNKWTNVQRDQPLEVDMLLRYGVANHRSIGDYQELSCAASKLKDDDRHLIHVDAKSLQGTFLPVIALYGANAAGKSNMLDALRFMLWQIETSFRNPRDMEALPTRPCKALGVKESEVSRYDCDVLIENVRHHYAFECTKTSFITERLYSYPNGSKTVLFERDFSRGDDKKIIFGSSIKGADKTLFDLASNRKALFLSSAGQTSHEVFKPVNVYFKEHFVSIQNLDTSVIEQSVIDGLAEPFVRGAVQDVLRQADFGISELEIEEAKIDEESRRVRKAIFKLLSEIVNDENFPEPEVKETEKKLYFVHKCGEAVFRLDPSDESTGTIHLLKLLVPTIVSLQKGKTLIIDEVTTTLHTKLSEELIRLFTNHETNKARAQFIFTTHDTNLLSQDTLRRDEIWFVQKSVDLTTSIFPLTDFRTRKSDNVENSYLLGRFGGVPAVGNLTRAVLANSSQNSAGEQ